MMAQDGLGTVIGNVEGTEASLKELQRLIAAQKLRELEARQAEQEQYERQQQAREFGLRERESTAREEQGRLTREMLETERQRTEARAQRDDTRASLEQLPIGTELSEPEFQQSGFDQPQTRALFKATPAYQPEGPVQEGGILPKVPARFRATGTAGQLAKQESERRAQENLERQEAGQREAERHNRAMEGRPQGQSTVIVRDFDPETGKQVTRIEPRQAGKSYETNLSPTADMRNRQVALGKAGPVFNAIDELSQRINVQAGVIAKISGAAERAKAQANLSDDVAEYEALVSGFTPLVARAVGHVGVLTEQDVQSVRKLFPAIGDSKNVRDRKIARLRSIMSQISGGKTDTDTAPTADPLGIRKGGGD